MKKRLSLSFSTFFTTGIMLAVLGILALVLRHPLIFPSLGPTAFLMASNPLSKIASPKNAILGHLIGIICGYTSLVIFGLTDTPAIIISGISIQFIAAAALSIALTSSLMILFSVEHPPAGATTLIISLGIMHTLPEIVVLMIAVILLCFLSSVLNRAIGIKYPVWSSIKKL